jgi:hypothetical protein
MTTGLDEPVVSALQDYVFLLDRGYPETPTLKLVGDRYRLSREVRMMLYRGACSRSVAEMRAAKRATPGRGVTVHVDGYNVIFTIVNYLQGKLVFRSLDGFVRDVGGSHGRVPRRELFLQAADVLSRGLASLSLEESVVHLDEPVSHSKEHRAALAEALSAMDPRARCVLSDSVDQILRAMGGRPAHGSEASSREALVVATSDSHIIEKVEVGVFDLGAYLLEREFAPRYTDLCEYLAAAGNRQSVKR